MFPTFHLNIGTISLTYSTQNALVLACFLAGMAFFTIRFRHQISWWKIQVMGFITGASTILGARLFHVYWERPQFFERHPELILSRFDGLTFYGGMALGSAVLFSLFLIFVPDKRVRTELYDNLALYTALTYGILRIGCFANGCCWGSICYLPWAVQYTNIHSAMPSLGIPVHPVQLYDSALGFVIFGVLLYFRENRVFRGHLFFLFGILYSIGRFVTEYFRGDDFRGVRLLGGFSTSQILSVGLFLFGTYKLSDPKRLKTCFHLFCFALLIQGCSLPQPPKKNVVSNTQILSDGSELHQMAPTRRTRPYNAIYAAVDNTVQAQFAPAFSKAYKREPAPRLEDISWWRLAPSFQKLYNQVVRLPFDRISKETLFRAITMMEAQGTPYDLILMTHGIPNHLVLSKGTPVLSFRDVGQLAGQLHNLHLVYLQACFGSTLVPDFHSAGARIILSFPEINRNFFFIDYFIRRYSKNPGYPGEAYKKTKETIGNKMRNSVVYSRIFSFLGTSADEYLANSPSPVYSEVP